MQAVRYFSEHSAAAAAPRLGARGSLITCITGRTSFSAWAARGSGITRTRLPQQSMAPKTVKLRRRRRRCTTAPLQMRRAGCWRCGPAAALRWHSASGSASLQAGAKISRTLPEGVTKFQIWLTLGARLHMRRPWLAASFVMPKPDDVTSTCRSPTLYDTSIKTDMRSCASRAELRRRRTWVRQRSIVQISVRWHLTPAAPGCCLRTTQRPCGCGAQRTGRSPTRCEWA